MDSHSILDHDSGEVPVPSESSKPAATHGPQPPQGDVRFPGEDGGKSLAEMAERDLTATLQLLAERAQYITGASGAAIALRDHEEMVCRASAGSSAPEVGAQLQVNSGLSGESVRTRQTLRCDDASTDERVNRESCEALGIRSVVVMPLLRGEDVIGVFELFSDQANIFETRDLAALERMGAMVHTALEHSAIALGLTSPVHGELTPSLPVSDNGNAPGGPPHDFAGADDNPSVHSVLATSEKTLSIPTSDNGHRTGSSLDEVATPAVSSGSSPGIAFHMKVAARGTEPSTPVETATSSTENDVPVTKSEEVEILEMPIEVSPAVPVVESPEDVLELEPAALAPPASIPSLTDPTEVERLATAPEEGRSAPVARGVVASLRKCEACGFPVSEGRQLCLDCAKKNAGQPASAKAQSSNPAAVSATPPPGAVNVPSRIPAADLPNFLGAHEPEASWLSTHKFMVVAIALAAIGIVAAVLLR